MELCVHCSENVGEKFHVHSQDFLKENDGLLWGRHLPKWEGLFCAIWSLPEFQPYLIVVAAVAVMARVKGVENDDIHM